MDGQVGIQQDDRDVDVGQKIGEIVVGTAQDLIAAYDFLGRRDQLLVAGLKFFLGGLVLLIDTLHFFVVGKKVFIGRLKPLVGRLLLFDDGFKVLGGDLQILFELDDAATFLFPPRLADSLLVESHDGGLLKENEKTFRTQIGGFDRQDLDLDAPRGSKRVRHRDLLAYDAGRLFRHVDGRPELQKKLF